MKTKFFCIVTLLALLPASCFANETTDINSCGNNVRCIRDKRISAGIRSSSRRLEERNASRRLNKEQRRVEFNKKLSDLGLPPVQKDQIPKN